MGIQIIPNDVKPHFVSVGTEDSEEKYKLDGNRKKWNKCFLPISKKISFHRLSLKGEFEGKGEIIGWGHR